jgi:hypothetical protein
MIIGHVLEAFLSGDWQSLLSSGVGALSLGAQKALQNMLNDLNPIKEFQKTLTDWAKNQFQDWFPSADELQRAIDDTKSLLNDVKAEGKQVFSDINNTVQNALGSGGIPAQTDGGLGATHDNFTPQGDVPTNVGTIPGMGTNEVGPSHGSGGGDDGSYGGSGSGSVTGTGSRGTPLGGSGSGSGSGTGSGTSTSGPTTTQQPTASDLGIDPNSGAYIEYQPSLGQVQIQYPNGTTETRPWPAS